MPPCTAPPLLTSPVVLQIQDDTGATLITIKEDGLLKIRGSRTAVKAAEAAVKKVKTTRFSLSWLTPRPQTARPLIFFPLAMTVTAPSHPCVCVCVARRWTATTRTAAPSS